MRRETHSSPVPHEELNGYDSRVIVAGSRRYEDYRFFVETMEGYERQYQAGKKVVYLSGKAKSGADAMVIRWCQETGRHWAEFPAEWENLDAPDAVVRMRKNWDGSETPYNVLAGFTRNILMSTFATDLVGFHDGITPGTGHMRKIMLEKVGAAHVWTLMIELPPKQGKVTMHSHSARGHNPLNTLQRKQDHG
jgi:hypothetical protein